MCLVVRQVYWVDVGAGEVELSDANVTVLGLVVISMGSCNGSRVKRKTGGKTKLTAGSSIRVAG